MNTLDGYPGSTPPQAPADLAKHRKGRKEIQEKNLKPGQDTMAAPETIHRPYCL